MKIYENSIEAKAGFGHLFFHENVPCGPAILLMYIYPKGLKLGFHRAHLCYGSFSHNSQVIETN